MFSKVCVCAAKQLEQLNARDIEYNGQKYTRYEISQMQRAKERTVRKWKRRYLAEDAAGTDTTQTAVKLRAAREELAAFTQATNSRADSSRTSVAGFGRRESSKATWAAKKDQRLTSKSLWGDENIESSENIDYTETKPSIEKPWKSWPRINGSHSSTGDILACNPRYHEGIEYRHNCQRCVPTYEMRRRGYDVTARPCSEDDELAQVKNMGAMFNNAKIERFPHGNGLKEIQERMKEWGDGARAEIVVDFGENAHAFVAEQKNGRTFFRDPQNGFINCSDNFTHVVDGRTLLMRIDDVEVNDTISKCCEVAIHDTI